MNAPTKDKWMSGSTLLKGDSPNCVFRAHVYFDDTLANPVYDHATGVIEGVRGGWFFEVHYPGYGGAMVKGECSDQLQAMRRAERYIDQLHAKKDER